MAPRRQVNYKKHNERLCKTGKEFEGALSALIDAAQKDVDQVCRSVMFDLYKELVQRTPKDTARAAAGFNINEEPSEWVPPPGDYDGGEGREPHHEMAENFQKVNAIRPGRPITISNNVEYLPALEDGHSRQAPKGFLAASLRGMAKRLEDAAEEFSKKKP